MPVNKVQPGDVITSADWNSMVDAIEALQAGNGQDGAVRILAVFPSGAVRVGDAIEIRGLNFGFSSGAARVHFDNVRVDPAQNSTDSVLHVTVPSLPALGTGGRQVALSVTRGTSSDSVNVQVLPMAVVLAGNVDVIRGPATPTDVPAGQRVEFRYEIGSRASAPADFLLTATAVPPAFDANLSIPDDGRVSGGLLHLANGESHEVVVVMDPIPAGTAGQDFTLTVGAAASGVNDSDSHTYTVGVDAGTPDPGIRILTGAVNPSNALAGGVMSVPIGVLGTIGLNLEFDELGQHDVTTTNSASGWTVFNTAPTFYEIEQADRDADGVARENPELRVLPGPSASGGILTVGITRDGQLPGTTMDIVLNPI